jgi:hypothetical protein
VKSIAFLLLTGREVVILRSGEPLPPVQDFLVRASIAVSSETLHEKALLQKV